jgi:predicted ATPase/DNA-binding winged helix-turn-helix (wHTH) protein
MTGDIVSFGPFELHRQQRRLTRDGRVVPLGSRALDLLLVLIDNAGQLVQKEQLIASVWPNVHVEDVALRVHIAGLRKVLGEGRPQSRDVVNVPGRGYQFVTPIRMKPTAVSPPAQTAPAAPSPDHLPHSTCIIGRDQEIEQIAARLSAERCVTIIGPGGIGKTTVGLAVAHRLAPQFADGAFFVDLAPLLDGRHIPGAIAAAIGIPGADGAPLERLVALLQDKTALILLDNCEHLSGEVAHVVGALMTTPNLKILATSRERLHVAKEKVYHLPTLQVPDEVAHLTVPDAMRYSAVELFVERATISNERFVLDPMNTAMVVEICRQLDGLALAIELAASRMDTFGVADIASMLTDRFRVLRRSPRDATSRHGSLLAALDWSYDLLDGELQAFLQRIATFASRFTLDDAVAMVDGAQTSKADVVDYLAELADKSFITVDLSESSAYYRLYETMRKYVRHKSQAAGTLDRIRHDHAVYMVQLFTRAAREAEQYRAADWLALYGRYLEDVRFAIDWSMATVGDKALAISLTASASTLWVYRSLLSELQHRCERALAELGPEAAQGSAREMTLFAALSYAMVNLYGPTPQGTQACRTALDIARKIGDHSSQVKSLLALWNGCFANGEVRQSLGLAQEFMTVAGKLGQADILVAHRMLGSSHFYLGNVGQARKHMEIMVSGYSATHHDAHLARFGFGQLSSGRGLLAFYLRYQGCFDGAMEATRRSVQEAVDSGHAMTICGVLGTTSVSNAIAIGHLDEAQSYVDILSAKARNHGLHRWGNFAIGFEGIICARTGKLDQAMQKLSRAVEQADDRANTRYMLIFSEYALVLGEIGDPEGGLAVINGTLDRLSGTGETWYEPELFRCRAELSRMSGLKEDKVEDLFQLAMARAQELDAVAFRLQAAKGLARYLHDRGRSQEGLKALKPVYDLFVEGHDSPELAQTRNLLEMLDGAGPCRPRLIYSA